jgi:hypothetical protein
MTNLESKPARPWDIFNGPLGRVSEKIIETRMQVCTGCKSFKKQIKVCKECGCFMPLKTMLPNAECPIGKWGTAPKEVQQEEIK